MKKQTETIYDFEVIFDPNGQGYTVTVPKLPGLVTEGNTLKNARAMAKNAIRCHVEGILKDHISVPSRTGKRRERIAVAV